MDAKPESEVDPRTRDHAELLSIVSHDIRAPLGVILAALAELNDPRVGTLTDDQRGLLLLVRRSSERLNRLAGNVQFLKRITSGDVRVSRQTLDLRDVARRAVESFEKSGEVGKKVIATLHVPADAVNASGDPEMLLQATTNLIANAIRAARGEVVVSALIEEGVPTLLVDDNGPGIPVALLPVLFAPGGAPGASVMSGVQRGLGLVVTRAIVGAHGAALSGENRADSSGKMLGARVRLALPEGAPRAQL